MTEDSRRRVHRRTLMQTGWIAPGLVAVTAAPAMASSDLLPALGITGGTPQYYSPGDSTFTTIRLVNTTDSAIPAGALRGVLSRGTGDSYFQGWTGQGWTRGSDDASLFTLDSALLPGGESSLIAPFFKNNDRSQSPAPTWIFTFTAPGARTTRLTIDVVS